MRAVFLDYDSLGPADVDSSPLTRLLPNLEFYGATQPAECIARIADAEVVFVNKVVLDAACLKSAQSLRLICVAATGTDNIDLNAATEQGITVCNIRNYCTPSVVQHVFGLLLALNQHLLSYRQQLQDGHWSSANQFCLLDPPVRELKGKTLGIVGLGNLGSAVARAADAFGLQVLAARRPYRLDDDYFMYDVGAGKAPRVGLKALLARSDYLSLHCPLTPETEHLINADSLALMRPGCVLINTARGGLVDPTALLGALRSGQLGAAGIDVLATEPPPAEHPLLTEQLPNLIVTPHQAWGAQEARQRAINELAANLAAFNKQEHRNRVN
ncbi:MAG: D-2-hydroxyacid dehydrogenase [Gammaproteobacteria bacterium]